MEFEGDIAQRYIIDRTTLIMENRYDSGNIKRLHFIVEKAINLLYNIYKPKQLRKMLLCGAIREESARRKNNMISASCTGRNERRSV